MNGQAANFDFTYVCPFPSCGGERARGRPRFEYGSASWLCVCLCARPSPLSRSPLCLGVGSGDYYFNDGLGHNYYANVCGNANQNCLPRSWLATYENGVAVQTWGSTPSCDRRNPSTLNCLEKSTQLPVCCTADCQVCVGVPLD